MVIGLLSHVLEKCKDTEPSVEVLLLFVIKNFLIRKITRQKNTIGEKNILSLMSGHIYVKPANVTGKEKEQGLAFFKYVSFRLLFSIRSGQE